MAKKKKKVLKESSTRVTKAVKEVVAVDPQLQIDPSGEYIIKTQDDALKAVELAGQVQLEVDLIKAQQLAPKEVSLTKLRKALNQYQKENDLAEIKGPNFHSDLVERTGSLWIWEESDIPENLDLGEIRITPLHSILKKKIKSVQKRVELVNFLTKRVLMSDRVDDAVKTGMLKTEDIEPAFVEFISTTYVMVKVNK